MKALTSVDVVLLMLAAGLWAAVIWRGVRSRSIGELWWSCVCLAVIVTLKVGVLSRPFHLATGGVFADVLIHNLAAAVAAMLSLQWQSIVTHGDRRHGLAARTTALVITLAVLIVTWFAAPVYGIPRTAPWLPAAVFNSPPMMLHWLSLQLFLLAVIGLFVRRARRAARELSRWPIRTSLRLLIAAAVLLLLDSAIQAVGYARTLLTGRRYPEWLFGPTNLLLIAVFALFLAGVSIPLARRVRRQRGSAGVDDAVASLWAWTQQAGWPADGASGQDQSLVIEGGRTILDQIIEIRDRMWTLQRHVAPVDLAAAGREARHRGLFGVPARAYVVAACLDLAAKAAADGASPVSPPAANLGNLGGGRTQQQEAQWLAAVWSQLRQLQAETASANTVGPGVRSARGDGTLA